MVEWALIINIACLHVPLLLGLVKSAGTLVVCPASLMMQWADEVRTKLYPHVLTTNIYHGSNRTGFARE